MAYKECPHCGEKVSASASRCIHCGSVLRKKLSKKARRLIKKLLTALIILILVAGASVAVWKIVLPNFSSISIGSSRSAIQFRNGITFEDTVEEVQDKETLKTTKTTNKDGTIRLLTEHGVIDDIPGSTIAYEFDSKGILCDIVISYRETSKDGDIKEADYSEINKHLHERFGTSIANKSTDRFVGSAIQNATLAISACKYIGGSGWAKDYDEWIIEDSEYNIKVEQINYLCFKSYSQAPSYGHFSSFTKF